MSTRAITPADTARIVYTIRVTIHMTWRFFEGDTRGGNHASIYLLTEDGTCSIRLNMTKADPTDTMGTYQLSFCNYCDSNSSLHSFDMQAAPGLTVQHVLYLIDRNQRNRYQLTRSGDGCRFWVQTVINDFEHNNFIASSSPLRAPSVIESLRYNYSKARPAEFEEVAPGTFV